MYKRFVCLTNLSAVLLAYALSFALLPVSAQETTAGMQGTVRDAQGAVVPGATVEATSPALVGGQKVTTDGAGYYHLTALPPGSYTLTLSGRGFRTVRRTGIELDAGSRRDGRPVHRATGPAQEHHQPH